MAECVSAVGKHHGPCRLARNCPKIPHRNATNSGRWAVPGKYFFSLDAVVLGAVYVVEYRTVQRWRGDAEADTDKVTFRTS